MVTMGMEEPPSRILRVASSPSTSGIWMSISTQSYLCWRSFFQRFHAVLRQLYRGARVGQRADGEFLVHEIIFRQQDVLALQRRHQQGFARLDEGSLQAPVTCRR